MHTEAFLDSFLLGVKMTHIVTFLHFNHKTRINYIFACVCIRGSNVTVLGSWTSLMNTQFKKKKKGGKDEGLRTVKKLL